ncbi:MAG: hypothetical protein ABEJ24_04880 [Candidatus Magasanikbacteria bacterium]
MRHTRDPLWLVFIKQERDELEVLFQEGKNEKVIKAKTSGEVQECINLSKSEEVERLIRLLRKNSNCCSVLGFLCTEIVVEDANYSPEEIMEKEVFGTSLSKCIPSIQKPQDYVEEIKFIKKKCLQYKISGSTFDDTPAS